MRKILTGLGCVILLILLSPLFLLAIGPLLTLAGLRGRQPAGPIIFDTSRYGLLGRIGIFLLGLVLWLLIWSGLGWVVVKGFWIAPAMVEAPSAVVSVLTPLTLLQPATATVLPSPTLRLEPAPSPAGTLPVETFTVTPTLSQTPESGQSQAEEPALSETKEPALSEVEGATPTPELFIPTPLNLTPTLTATLTVSASTPAPTPTPTRQNSEQSAGQDEGANRGKLQDTIPLTTPLTLADQQQAIAAVENGNGLLRDTIASADPDNMQKLAEIWQGEALGKAQTFATGLYQQYAKPFVVKLEYLTPPAIGPSSPGQVTVISEENWTYQGRSQTERESFQFVYTLTKINDRWVIIHYNYRNLSWPTAIPGQ